MVSVMVHYYGYMIHQILRMNTTCDIIVLVRVWWCCITNVESNTYDYVMVLYHQHGWMTNYDPSSKITNTFGTRFDVFNTTTSNIRDGFDVKTKMAILRKCMKDACITVTSLYIHVKCLSLNHNAVRVTASIIIYCFPSCVFHDTPRL